MTTAKTIREEDKDIIFKACSMISSICKEHPTCKGCPFEQETHDHYYDCILDKPPAELDADAIVKCFT